MKYLFYTILFVAAAGTVAAIVEPDLVKRGAALLGLELSDNSAESAKPLSEQDRLDQFYSQYPLAQNQQAEFVPSYNVPMIVVPEPNQPTLPMFQPAPATAFPVPSSPPIPQPVVEPAANAYTTNGNTNNWDSDAAAPIATPPVVDYTQQDWTGPSQPYQYQENVPAVQPPADVFTGNIYEVPGDIPHFEQTRLTEPIIVPPPRATLQTPATLIEDVPVPGTETVARVGTEVILMGDILPKLRRIALQVISENVKRMSEADRAKITQEEIEKFTNEIATGYYPMVLEEQILFALIHNDYDMSQDRASKAMFLEKMGEEFDRVEVPEMLKELNLENVAALKKYLTEQLGSSLEKERRHWVREQIARQWMGMAKQRATTECTHDEMMEFYERNQAMFTSTAKARWQEMVVYLSKHSTEQEAWNKIRWMGNQAANGAPFAEIAKANSDGFTASEGGVWDWVTKGSLSSAELEQAVFSQPVGQLSPAILRSERGLHIILVLERQEATVLPFVEAQVKIREMIRRERSQRYDEEYLADLRRRFPTVIVKDRIDFNVNHVRTASSGW